MNVKLQNAHIVPIFLAVAEFPHSLRFDLACSAP